MRTEIPAIVESVPAVVFRLSHKGDNWSTWFVTENISMYGYTVDEFRSGQVCWFDLVHPDDRVLLSKTISDYEAHSINAFKLYYRLMTKDGSSVPVTEHNTVHRDKNGRIVCYDTVIFSNSQSEDSRRLIDDHDRQQLVLNDILMSLHDSKPENALQIILDRTGAYLDTSRALLFKDSADHKTCKIVYEWCNRDITSVMALDYSITYETGMPEIYIALQTTGNLLINYGEIPENCREEFEAEGLIASAIFAVYLEGDHYGFVCFDDCVVERFWDENTVRFLKNVSNLISTVIARQHAAERLRQNQRTYEAVLNNVDSFIFVIDPQTDEIIFANHAFKQTFAEACEGHKATEFLDFDFHTPYGGRTLLPMAENGVADYPELYCPQTKGWLAVSCELISWLDGRQVRLVNCYDITAKKLFADTLEERIEERTHELKLMTMEAERAQKEAEKAAVAKSQFLANMSHEMRTPMNAIIGMTNIAKASQEMERKDYCISKIEEASAHLLGVINDILDMSKIEANRFEILLNEFDFEQMLMHVTNVMAYSVNQKKQKLHVKIEEMPRYLLSDEQRLAQVVTNLLSNAVKFTPEGGDITLRARLLEQMDEDYLLEVSVQDTGIGISEEQQQRLFRSFEQADTGVSRRYGGTGLGLAISKSIVEMLGGEIRVESRLDQGSLFVFTFRAKRSSGLTHSRLQEEVNWDSVRIMAVDDASEVRDYFMELADKFHFHCQVASGGDEACQLLEQSEQSYHIIFVDWNMAEMNGIELAQRIRSYGDAIVIMISAMDWSDVEAEARAAGVDRHVAKPLFPSAIIDCIMDCLNPQTLLAETKASEGDALVLHGKRILLVEDVEINREIVISLLEPTGVDIECAENGLQALQAVEKDPQRYDLILMDIHMPEMDGYQATQQIRSLKAEAAQRVPIIAMTANVFREDVERCLQSGMNDHVGKPLNMTELLGKLHQYLNA